MSLLPSLIIIKKHFTMANKLNYDAKTILNIKFSPAEKGYDSLEVDKVFDKIINDYEVTASYLNQLETVNAKQQAKNEELKKEIEKLNFELTSLKKKFDSLKQLSSVNGDNYELIQKITAYERVLYKKGINPKKALSDPDNC